MNGPITSDSALRTTWLVRALGAVALLVATQAAATPIATQFVRTAPNFFAGVAFDSVTGKVYELPGYGPGFSRTGNAFTVFGSVALFESGTSSGTVTTASTWGTYAVAQNDELFARTSTTLVGGQPVDAQLTEFSAIGGAPIQTINPPNLGGGNGTDTFDWGGFSAVNALSDGTDLYVVSHTAGGGSGDWTIDVYDFALNLLDTSQVTLAIGNPGYAFAIAGTLFFGDDYSSGHVGSRVDPFTGALTAVDFTLAPLGGGYVNNTAYSAATNTLYLVSAGSYYKVANASLAFGVNAVPEPATLALVGVGLLGCGCIRRRGGKSAAGA